MIVELYKLCDKTKREELEEVCGIYAILYNNEVIYVGQSINIRSRLASHTNKARIDEYAKRDQHNYAGVYIRYKKAQRVTENLQLK